MQLDKKKVLVVGLARSGVAVAKFCAARGATVTVTDRADEVRLAKAVAALDGCATLQLGSHRLESFVGADLIVMSPGVPEIAETTAARAAGVEVIAEIELGYRFLHAEATLIAITGTNGKSTTTALIGALCAASGRPTFCGGNLGEPLITAADGPANVAGGLVVAEVAGFQLETCTRFRPKVAVALNITEDHLDRYGTMDVYAAMKNRVFRWQTQDDFAVANGQDARVREAAMAAQAPVYLFSRSEDVARGAILRGDEMVLRLGDGSEERYSARLVRLVGAHNMENAMAATLAARLAGVPAAVISGALPNFRPLAHRMELVGEKDGVRFYNDSKATNVAAVAAALTGFPSRVVLIAGGVDKGGSYKPLIDAFRPLAAGAVLIGAAAPLISQALTDGNVACPVRTADTMQEAVEIAAHLAAASEAVVLAPACASYDMFSSFEERGASFRAAALKIGAKPVGPA